MAGHSHQHHGGHGHHHHHIDPEAGDWRVGGAIAVNLALTLAQIVGGLVSGSLALIADALHNLSDAVSLGIALAARRIARRPADAEMTFGYGRAEVVAALVNYTTLILIGLYLGYEAIARIFAPEPVIGWIMIWVAGLALVVDLVTAALTYTMSKDSVNIRAAFAHNLADALGSVAVIVAGVAVLVFGWVWVDPAVTLAIAGYILWMSLGQIGGVIRILMLGAPPDLDTAAVLDHLRGIDGVASVHHVHLWQMQENTPALDAHVAVPQGRWGEADAIKARVKRALEERYGIGHVTLEMECAAHACDGASAIGHG
ncbi:cobalt-zinc-cadmium efflux system protein [Limimaricola soesokkakensis]|uniref:Cadmium, cobalt and zinc/H(+)-K(+) antiporter n=1 Tax=Limimaricola soesokkakensis TaxID=1343159 RepID=A0A1X6YQ83_9RHOB|nr:cation diffusion facilitator family transporter [Limimaricola soesokkakensis]PSK88238.1 cobalt-zinc-cadmium efflux system protein [Limimaricola soesokkakensis]SLN28207.1 Cadmium, cobalt and zinc/H(+)-K(+) antiporter [Limimaricola soesokkakensis]